MIERFRRAETWRWHRALCLLSSGALAASLSCGKASGPRLDSESHFFVPCVVDADCTAISGASCVDGLCSGPDAAALGGPETQPAGQPQPTSGLAECRLAPGDEIRDQASIDALEGCEVIRGSLDIAFPGDLRPLHALRRITADLVIHPTLRRLPSLEGLENLEQVDFDVHLKSLAVPSLASLSSLVSIGSIQGGLTLEDTELKDLSGLERVTALSRVVLSSNPELTTLAPLSFPEHLYNLVLSDNPLLTELTALSGVVAIDDLTIARSALQDLGAFAELRRAGELGLVDNPLLADVSALRKVMALRNLFVSGNPQLAALDLNPLVTGLEQIWLAKNPALTSVSGLHRLRALGSLRATDNPLLGALNLPVLESLPNLELIRNASMSQVDVGTNGVRYVVVVSNPNLDIAPYMWLNSYQTKVGGNLGEPTGLDPCPWAFDGYCDALPRDTLCAAGTDPVDCSDERADIYP